ncbi:MAG TPA: mechanosensitive ion channel family protein [Terracidiphilus sp.]|nr:mechanosensitive ion channel family protein [Terracidiphilus sp.]
MSRGHRLKMSNDQQRGRFLPFRNTAILTLLVITSVIASFPSRASARGAGNTFVPVFDSSLGIVWRSGRISDVAELYGQEIVEGRKIESRLPRFLVTERVFGTSLWRWIFFLLLFLPALAVSWGVVSLLRRAIRMWMRWRPHPVLQNLHDSIAAPAKLVLTILFHRIGVALLGLPVPFREHYAGFVGIVLTAGMAWLTVRLIGHWAERVQVTASADSSGGGSIVVLGERFLKVLVAVVAALLIFSMAGFDITTAIAGLGIGSVALALAAQKTLENLLGGISIMADRVMHVGDLCRIGGTIGRVEAINLRSTRIRTLDSTELSIPNGQLAIMNIENLSRYDKSSFITKLQLRRETTPDQLRALMTEVRVFLYEHPKVDPDVVRVRLIGFGESSLDVEIFCHILTGNPNEFFAIREELLLRIMDLINRSGTALALPSRALLINQDQGLNQEWFPLTKQSAHERRGA